MILALACAAALAADSTATPSPTAVDPLVGHFNVKVYNSAAELVANVYEGVTSSDPSGLRAAPAPTPLYATTVVQIFLEGISPAQDIFWNGLDLSGQPAAAGIYVIKAEIQEADGSTANLVTSVATFGPTELSVQVYNAAGELVRQLYSGIIMAAPTSMSLSAATLTLGSGTVTVLLSGLQPANAPITWDGTDQDGHAVVPGAYTVQSAYSGGGAPRVVDTRPLSVLPAATPTPTSTSTATPGSSAHVPIPRKAVAGLPLGPNPVAHGQPLCLSFNTAPLQCALDVFSLSGAKITHRVFDHPGFSACWSTGSVAPGIYLIHLDVTDVGGDKEERWQKVAVIR